MTYEETTRQTPVTLVEFYASWCPHCLKMAPVVESVKKALAGKVSVSQFDIDNYEQLADDQKIDTVPTFILYSDGKEVWRHSGEIEAEDLIVRIEKELRG